MPLFFDWAMGTNGEESEIIATAPASFVVGGSAPTYHFTFARNKVRLNLDNFLPLLWFNLDDGNDAQNVRVHRFRLEVYEASQFVFFIDDEQVATGVSVQGPFPSHETVLGARAKSYYLPSTTKFDYVRYGRIPHDSSGDFDSDGDRDSRDLYYFRECMCRCMEAESLDLHDPGAPTECNCTEADAGPSCRWADLDADGDVDFADFGLFQRAFSGSGE